jgi:cytidylate kinase
VSCSVVCISHATGAGGEEIGRRVAERLGFLYVDEAIIAAAAATGGISAADVASEERRKSLALRVLDAVAEGGAAAWSMTSGAPLVSPEELSGEPVRALIREAIEQTASRGRVVIVAHAASRALAPGTAVLRAFVTASPATRARRLSEAEGVDEKQATRAVKDADAARLDYLKRFYDVDEELPTDYDVVLNTDVISSKRAADLLVQAASS